MTHTTWIIWTNEGSWLQARDPNGTLRWSFIGLHDREEQREFCEDRGIGFSVYERRANGVSKVNLTSAQAQLVRT